MQIRRYHLADLGGYGQIQIESRSIRAEELAKDHLAARLAA
jgi:hypothetical protein